jgi:hypothetical protein
LGYAYDGDNPLGRRVHSPGTKPDKDKLYDLYDSTGVVGFINGLIQRITEFNVARIYLTFHATNYQQHITYSRINQERYAIPASS